MGLDDFEVMQPLGKGAFAQVDKVKRKADGKVYALKRVDIATIPQKDLHDALNEIRILASFKHPRLIRWYETFIAESSSSELCIVMEYCPYGDLEQKIKRHQHRKQYIDEREIWVYAINILEGLAALHAKGVVHRDLKPANCLIDPQGCVKIADMNISKVSKGDNMQTQVGTPYFICPEIYLKKPYSSTSDIWSLGGVLYNLAALHPPFLADNIQNLRKAVVKGTYDALPAVYGASLGTLIGRFLQLNPSDRPEAKDVLGDPLIERHRYLLLHPLPQGKEDAEGEMLPTIKVASDKQGVKTIALPGPAYEDSVGGTPRSPTSVVVVYSPRSAARRKEKAAAAAAAPTSPSALQRPVAPKSRPAATPPPSPPPIETAQQPPSTAPAAAVRPATISLSREASPTPPPSRQDSEEKPARPTSLPFGGLNLKAPVFKSPFASQASGEQPSSPLPQQPKKSPTRPFSLGPRSSNHAQPAPEVAWDGFLGAAPVAGGGGGGGDGGNAGWEEEGQRRQSQTTLSSPPQEQDRPGGDKRSSIRRILDDMEQRRLSGFVSGSSGAPSFPPASGGNSGESRLTGEMKRFFTGQGQRSPTAAGATTTTPPEAAPARGGLKWPGVSPKAK